jgi:type IV secretory pathway component VirB8
MPILERTPEVGAAQTAMPRILLQVAGSSHAAWKVTVLSGIFLLVALLELCILLRLPQQDPVVVYGDFPRTTLLESIR